MSEPTYRIELHHDPASGAAVCWTADVFLVADDTYRAADFWGATREAAFDKAQEYCRARNEPPEAPSTVFLSEEGDILYPIDFSCVPDESGGVRDA